jgi:hypothetical protein
MSEHFRSIDLRHHSIRQDNIENGMRIGGVSSKNNTADILTKALQPDLHTRHTSFLLPKRPIPETHHAPVTNSDSWSSSDTTNTTITPTISPTTRRNTQNLTTTHTVGQLNTQHRTTFQHIPSNNHIADILTIAQSPYHPTYTIDMAVNSLPTTHPQINPSQKYTSLIWSHTPT